MANTRTILITGGMSDIGKAIARSFAFTGFNVIITYRKNPEQAELFIKSLKKSRKNTKVVSLKTDVRNLSDVHGLFNKVFRMFGNLDTIINNAGINLDNSFLQMSDEEWNTVVSTVLYGTFVCSQEFAKRYDGRSGNIINIGAVTAFKGRKNGANYCSARAGVIALTKCMALELAPNIRVNSVTPGSIYTAELRSRYKLDDENNLQNMKNMIPLGELGKPEDIADIIQYIVSPERYITGQNFMVDGGLYMR